MDPFWIGISVILLFLILVFLGVYVGVALGIAAVIGLIAIVGLRSAVSLTTTSFFYFVTKESLIVLPLFILLGYLASGGEIASRAFAALSKWLGRMPGGLGLSTIGLATLLGSVTGSSYVTAVLMAQVAAPQMIKHGYSKRIAYGLAASSGIIGMLIPPSILAVYWALLVEVSLAKMLLAGIGAGLVVAICLSAGLILWISVKPSLAPRTSQASSWTERLKAVPALWPFALIVGVIWGGIFAGVFTVVEAAAIAVFAFTCVLAITGTLHWPFLKSCLLRTASLTAAIYLILLSATLFSRCLGVSGVGTRLVDVILSLHPTPFLLMVGLSLLYLFLGCFMGTLEMMALTIPFVLPLMQSMNIDFVWAGVVLITASQIGIITPPVGVAVYLVQSVAGPDATTEDIFAGSFPFFLAQVLATAILIAFPAVSMIFPNLIA